MLVAKYFGFDFEFVFKCQATRQYQNVDIAPSGIVIHPRTKKVDSGQGILFKNGRRYDSDFFGFKSHKYKGNR